MGLACTIATECVLQKGDIDDRMAIRVGRPCAMDALENAEMAVVASARAKGRAAMRRKGFAGLGAGGVLLLAAVGYAVEAAQSAAAAPLAHVGTESHPIGAAANWLAHNADTDETAYSRLDQISTATVGRLGLAWSMDLPEVSLEATPLAVDGVLYFTGSQATVYAVDGLSGKLRWKYDPKSWKLYPQKTLFGG